MSSSGRRPRGSRSPKGFGLPGLVVVMQQQPETGPSENKAMVFLSAFLASLIFSAVGFYAAYAAPWSALAIIMSFIVVEAVAVLPMYQNKAVYGLGMGIGLLSGFLVKDIVKLMFDGLMYAGVLIGRAAAFTTSPSSYDAAALMMFLVVTTQYAIVMAVNTILMSLFITAAIEWWYYPDLLFVVGIATMYPFYGMWLYMFTWGLLYLVFSGAVYMFWLSNFSTAFLGAVGFIEFMLALLGLSMIGTKLVSQVYASIADAIASMAGMYVEAGEMEAFSRSSMFYFIIYSFGAGIVGLIARLYPYYASIFMVAYTIVALGVWSTFVVTPVVTRPHAKLTWRTLRRIITNGATAIAMTVVAFMIGYGHASQIIGYAAMDFLNYYGESIREFIGDVIRWILAPV